MADNIKSYTANKTRLNPSDLGIRAAGSAGGRIGSLYNQAASDVRERGSLSAKAIKDRIWPFDIYALNEKQSTTTTSRRADDTSGGFKVVGGFESYGGPTEGGATYTDYARSGSRYADNRQTSRGAAALTGVARKIATDSGYRQGVFDAQGNEIAGVDLELDRPLEKGELGSRDNPIQDPHPSPNEEAFKNASDWYTQREKDLSSPTQKSIAAYDKEQGTGFDYPEGESGGSDEGAKTSKWWWPF